MSQSTVYIQANKLIPGPDFRVSRNSENAWSGSMSFTCRYVDWTTSLQSLFFKDTPITDIYESLDPSYSFLRVTSAGVEMQAGGLTRVNVEFGGTPPEEFVPDPGTGGTNTFQLTSVQEERPISENPDIPAHFASIINGTGKVLEFGNDPDSNGDVTVITTDGLQNVIGKINRYVGGDSGVVNKWYDLVVDRAITTYQKSNFEWSQNATNLGGLDSDEYKYLGFLTEDPDKLPKAATLQSQGASKTWLLTSINETRTTMLGNRSENSVTWTKTWRKLTGEQKINDFLYRDLPPET